MSEQDNPLPADHAFVLQIQESRECPDICHRGRVEHLATGKATRFTTTADFWNFVDEVLTELARNE